MHVFLYLRKTIFSILSLLSLTLITMLVADPNQEHQPLMYQNKFKNPQKVVNYYVKRDASGFVWSGLLDIERRKFTTWESIPNQDSFYFASNYQIKKQKIHNKQAQFKVSYHILGIADAHGTLMATDKEKHSVVFKLVKNDGKWKIAQPSPNQLMPVIVERHAPNTIAQANSP